MHLIMWEFAILKCLTILAGLTYFLFLFPVQAAAF